MSEYVVEYAKSGRSTCKGKCKTAIAQGTVRFGSTSDKPEGGHASTYWRCIACVTAKVLKNVLEKYNSLDKIPGVDTLKDEDREKVLSDLEAINKAAGEPKPKKAAAPRKKKEAGDEDKPKKAKKPAKKRAKDEDDDDDDEEEEEEKPKKQKKAPAKKGKGKKKSEDDDDEEPEEEPEEDDD